MIKYVVVNSSAHDWVHGGRTDASEVAYSAPIPHVAREAKDYWMVCATMWAKSRAMEGLGTPKREIATQKNAGKGMERNCLERLDNKKPAK